MKRTLFPLMLALPACVYVVPPNTDASSYPTHQPNVIIIPNQHDYPRSTHQGLIRTASGQCLDQSGSNYRGVIAYRCHGKANQRFKFVNSQIKMNGQCLDVGGEHQDDGTKVITYRCHGGENQQWFRDGQQIRSAMSGKCLDIGKQGNKLAIYQCDGSRGQQFFY